MAILKVARMGHPVLREQCKPIDPAKITGPEVQRLIRDMLETMIEYNGVGLAAPQVYTPVRLVIAGGEESEGGRPRLRVLINPEIEVLDDEEEDGKEIDAMAVSTNVNIRCVSSAFSSKSKGTVIAISSSFLLAATISEIICPVALTRSTSSTETMI